MTLFRPLDSALNHSIRKGSGATYLYDLFPWLVDGFSFHKLKGDYTGPCVEITRDSDSLPSDISFSSDYLNTADALSFSSGTIGRVSRIYNQFGGSDMVPPTSAMPILCEAGGTIPTNNGVQGMRSEPGVDRAGLAFDWNNQALSANLSMSGFSVIMSTTSMDPSENYFGRSFARPAAKFKTFKFLTSNNTNLTATGVVNTYAPTNSFTFMVDRGIDNRVAIWLDGVFNTQKSATVDENAIAVEMGNAAIPASANVEAFFTTAVFWSDVAGQSSNVPALAAALRALHGV